MSDSSSILRILLYTLLGALCGTVAGMAMGYFIPALKGFLSQGVNLGVDLYVVQAGIRFNTASVIGVAAALLLLRRRA